MYEQVMLAVPLAETIFFFFLLKKLFINYTMITNII